MLNFLRLRTLYFVLSLVVIIPGLMSLATYGLRPSIDFTGGTEVELQVASVQNDTAKIIQESAETVLPVKEVEVRANNRFIVRADAITPDQRALLIAAVRSAVGAVTELRYETIGPVLGRELLQKTITALILSASGITIYVAYRFRELRYGVCAVLAMLHDSLVVFGVFSLLGRFLGVEVDVLFVTAVLTVLSFSVHDTIVVYDRIRELRRKQPNLPYEDTLNLAVTETLSRSINNSMTIIFMLTALWLLGGETIRWFVFALLIGVVTGTYSSTFTAVPLLSLWETIATRRAQSGRHKN